MAGDLTLIPEIERRCSMWQASNTGRAVQDQLLTSIPDLDEASTVNPEEERDVQEQLAGELNGAMEVRTRAGYIDILTEEEVVEVKHHQAWKAAIGQVLAYQRDYPNKQARVHLFAEAKDLVLATQHFTLCKEVCDPLGVTVSLLIK